MQKNSSKKNNKKSGIGIPIDKLIKTQAEIKENLTRKFAPKIETALNQKEKKQIKNEIKAEKDELLNKHIQNLLNKIKKNQETSS